MGSKARLSKDIVPILNSAIAENSIDTYVEPFVGGANIIEQIRCKNKIGADNNEYLIEMWQELQRGWIPPNTVSKLEYDSVKSNMGIYPKNLVSIVGFCATYNAKWFGGYAGVVNTKIGTTRNYYNEAVRNILNQVNKLRDVQFVCCDYKEFSDIKGALFYCDSPYQNTTKYKDTFNHNEYWEWVRYISKNNIVYVSEYNAPPEFKCVYEKQLTTTLDKNSRKCNVEKLFVLRG